MSLGRLLRRVLNPAYEEDRARLARIERQQAEALSALRGEMTRLSQQITGLGLDRTLRALDRRIEHVGERLAQIREVAGRHYRLTAQAARDTAWHDEQRALERRVVERAARIRRSGRPVVIGPWTGEVGFELLYWVPFVTWLVEEAQVAPDRLLIVSRGGPRSWYAHLGGRYADVFAQVAPDEFRAATEAAKKQRRVTAFDRRVLRRAMRDAGLGRAHLVHPDLMYRLFYPFWKQQVPVRRVEDFTRPRRLAGPQRSDVAARLPAEYVAVRFYFSDCFPETPGNRAFVASVIHQLSATIDVVVLNTGFRVDDHRDAAPSAGGRIHAIDDLMAPDGNLDVQTAAIAGARAFVGTYGGYAYLAPLLGVDSLAFYSVEDAFFAHHLELARRVFRSLGAGSLVPLDVRDAGLVKLALAGREARQGALRP